MRLLVPQLSGNKKEPAWLLMTVASVLAYTPAITFGADEPLKNSLLMLSLEYGPVYLWLA